jgi:hypothetical protein
MEKKGNGIFIVVISLIVLVGGGVAFLLYRKAKAKDKPAIDEVTDDGIKSDEVANVVKEEVKDKPKVNDDTKLKLGSDNSNVSAIKNIINQVALWKNLKTSNGVNFPIDTDNKFTSNTDKAVSIFFPSYKTNGYITRKDARFLWSYSAGLNNKTFPSSLVGISDEKSYRSSYAKGKEKSKKKFSSYGKFVETKDNFSK